MKDAAKIITDYGWEVERQYVIANGNRIYRAFQGGFKTLWRDTPEQVLSDVQAIVEARKQPSSAPF